MYNVVYVHSPKLDVWANCWKHLCWMSWS